MSAFAISATAVSNDEFVAFVTDTGYRTEAEDFGSSYVVASFLPGSLRAISGRVQAAPWWCAVQGAWNEPEGHGPDLADRVDHTVVHVSWRDGQAFVDWAGS